MEEEYEEQILSLMRDKRTDSLTGLGNYAAFMEYCRNLAGLGIPFSIVIFDMTNLKRANTVLGHFGADVLLSAVGGMIRGAGDRRSAGNALGFDAVFRHGGDEFAVVLPGAPPAGALAVRDRIEEKVGQQILADGTLVRAVGAVAHMPPGGLLEDELNRADGALEHRKREWKAQQCSRSDV